MRFREAETVRSSPKQSVPSEDPYHAGPSLRAAAFRAVRPLLALTLMLLLTACGGGDEDGGDANADLIEASLEAYLPQLAYAYASGDTSTLSGHAAPREIASVEKRIEDIAAMGRILQPTFKELTIEDVNAWSHSNAYVTTLEVWDLRTVAAGSDVVLAEELDQASRVKYQIKREDDRWMVLFRAIQQ